MKLQKRPITQVKRYQDNKNYPTNFAHQDRMALFAPYVKLNKTNLATKQNPVIVTTSYGIVRFENGLLDQTHRDIWQILSTYPEEFGILTGKDTFDNDTWSFTFTSYQLSKYLGLKDCPKDWLLKKLKEMKNVSFTLIPNKNEELEKYFKFGLAYTSVLDNVGLKEGKLFVTVSPFFLQCYLYDTAIHTEKLTHDLLKIKEGYLKALAHFVLTHQNYHNSLENLMLAIGLPSRKENLKEYNRYKNYITKPLISQTLKEKFKILLTQDLLSKKWRVDYEQRNLDGKVWSDNEYNQYSRHILKKHEDRNKNENLKSY